MSADRNKQSQLGENAELALRNYVIDYAKTILYQAKVNAHRENQKEVRISHIEEAIENLSRSRKRYDFKDLLTIVGGALLGAFVQGFAAEAFGDKNMPLITVYVIFGVVGIALVVWGLSR
jgi:hypothetical protein